MKLLRQFVTIACMLIGAIAHAAGDYEQHIQKLAAGTPPEEIKASLQALADAGSAAFPALLSHFSDMTPAEPRFFQRAEIEITPDGTSRVHAPLIGEACFDILQDQIEGNWPKGFRHYYVLTPSNTEQWLDAHRGFTLPQLRRSARTESLGRAEADLAKDQADDFLKKTVAFLRKEIAALK